MWCLAGAWEMKAIQSLVMCNDIELCFAREGGGWRVVLVAEDVLELDFDVDVGKNTLDGAEDVEVCGKRMESMEVLTTVDGRFAVTVKKKSLFGGVSDVDVGKKFVEEDKDGQDAIKFTGIRLHADFITK